MCRSPGVGDRGADVMTDKMESFLPLLLDQRSDVLGDVGSVRSIRRFVGCSEAAQVWGGDRKACLNEMGHDMPPFAPVLGKTMQQHNQWTVAAPDIVDARATIPGNEFVAEHAAEVGFI